MNAVVDALALLIAPGLGLVIAIGLALSVGDARLVGAAGGRQLTGQPTQRGLFRQLAVDLAETRAALPAAVGLLGVALFSVGAWLGSLGPATPLARVLAPLPLLLSPMVSVWLLGLTRPSTAARRGLDLLVAYEVAAFCGLAAMILPAFAARRADIPAGVPVALGALVAVAAWTGSLLVLERAFELDGPGASPAPSLDRATWGGWLYAAALALALALPPADAAPTARLIWLGAALVGLLALHLAGSRLRPERWLGTLPLPLWLLGAVALLMALLPA